MEDLGVDLGKDASVGAKSGRNVLAAKKEANGTVEQTLEDGTLDEFGETGVVSCSENEHVAELAKSRIG